MIKRNIKNLFLASTLYFRSIVSCFRMFMAINQNVFAAGKLINIFRVLYTANGSWNWRPKSTGVTD